MNNLVRKMFPLVLILSAFVYVQDLSADMKITLKDGKVLTVPVSRENVESIEYSKPVDPDEVTLSGNNKTQVVYREDSIRIESAKYGNVSFELGNELGYKQYFCDAKEALTEMCEGADGCKIIVGSQICGDPYPGKGKYLYVEYSCGDKLKRAKNTQTEIMKLKCP
ncbi:hypothetical protein [Desulfovibrio gilichinskyi]|uniref:Galactose binding lectin domain-containing protein n=1 Tax=Desulfovibrio gilichinskyi TaxID=1519643 RepID=A0A1X7DKT7_9BACT|nr:hypothetical protein [Desulfovibrio gilichinskyi]SMF17361.1 Galactose binding lectin domain-containing protein [Desulfovibrio gilichinskyi]